MFQWPIVKLRNLKLAYDDDDDDYVPAAQTWNSYGHRSSDLVQPWKYVKSDLDQHLEASLNLCYTTFYTPHTCTCAHVGTEAFKFPTLNSFISKWRLLLTRPGKMKLNVDVARMLVASSPHYQKRQRNLWETDIHMAQTNIIPDRLTYALKELWKHRFLVLSRTGLQTHLIISTDAQNINSRIQHPFWRLQWKFEGYRYIWRKAIIKKG